MATFALIPAAGSGTRLAAASPKQYLALAGKPMLWHAIRALCVPQVTAVFVVLPANDEQFARHDWRAFEGKLNPLYCGGETRRDSVLNGLVAARGTLNADDWVLVHDAARPCLPAADLRRLLDEGGQDAIGAILALPVAETVKTAGKDEAGVQRVAATQDRSQLWLAQTPQMFRAGLLTQALSRAADATDEASAVEKMGLRPRLVLGSRQNLKVTYPEDVAIAEAILARAT
ncbi:MAG TPA: 2-C-methyl-D-erythritol 4-phosphate cytidylyltransferase [Burkholderiales bacterium]|nr:2-C-methyl-D-erythritol 4-phosphate cytidylyltransferase [Burkholderiales bacterium]